MRRLNRKRQVQLGAQGAQLLGNCLWAGPGSKRRKAPVSENSSCLNEFSFWHAFCINGLELVARVPASHSAGCWSESGRLWGRHPYRCTAGQKPGRPRWPRDWRSDGLSPFPFCNFLQEGSAMNKLTSFLRFVVVASALTAAFTSIACAAPKKDFKIAWSIYVGWMPWAMRRIPAS